MDTIDAILTIAGLYVLAHCLAHYLGARRQINDLLKKMEAKNVARD